MFFLSLDFVHADNFYITQDYADNSVFVTALLSIDELPSGDVNDLYTIEYELNNVLGLTTDALKESAVWDNHITIESGRYRRITGVNDRISLPPFGKFSVLAFIKNESGHEVTLKDWLIFTTHTFVEGNGWGRLGIESEFAEVDYKFMGTMRRKDGRAFFSPVVIDVDEDETKVVEIASFEIAQTLSIEHFDWTPHVAQNGDLIIDFVLKVKNIGTYNLNNINLTHKTFSLTRSFLSGSEYTYEYQVNYGKNYSSGVNLLESFRIYKPTPSTNCVVYPNKDSNGSDGRSKSLVFSRSDVEVEDWFGRTVDIDWYMHNETMCVESMRYWLVGKDLEYSPPMDIEVGFVEQGRVLDINDDFVVNMRLKNLGETLDNLSLKLDFDPSFQRVKQHNCTLNSSEDGLVWEIVSLSTGNEVFCDVLFEIIEKENFLKLKNSLVLNNKVRDVVEFSFVPDIETSLEYDFSKNEFVFQSNFLNITNLNIVEDIKGGLLCNSFVFLNLRDEVCI